MNKTKLKALALPLLKNAVSIRLRAEKVLLKRGKMAEYNPALEQDLDIIRHQRGSEAIPKQIWMFWAGETLPHEIQCFVNKVSRENPGYTLTVVNNANLQQYLPGLVFKHQDMKVAHKSDVIRLELLYKYGGIWMDASTILNRSLDELLAVNLDNRYDMVAFYRDVSTIDKHYPIIETWFMAVPKNSDFIKRWLHYFRPIVELGARNHFIQLKNLPNYTEILQRITDPEYLILNITQQQALREFSQYNFYLRKCEANAIFYQRLVSWDAVKLSRMFMIDRVPDVLPPLVKLTGLDRKYLATNLRYGAINKDSLIGQVLFAESKETLPKMPFSDMPGSPA
ncbi:capsular polysaccharide synthesis protein [Pantoea sp. MBD-2R]|uniref:glycosyltransferase family 32 protein n=1 Tax=Pantoea sp. MBD-2R TaxID=3141540 RepID=UPI0031835A8C